MYLHADQAPLNYSCSLVAPNPYGVAVYRLRIGNKFFIIYRATHVRRKQQLDSSGRGGEKIQAEEWAELRGRNHMITAPDEKYE